MCGTCAAYAIVLNAAIRVLKYECLIRKGNSHQFYLQNARDERERLVNKSTFRKESEVTTELEECQHDVGGTPKYSHEAVMAFLRKQWWQITNDGGDQPTPRTVVISSMISTDAAPSMRSTAVAAPSEPPVKRQRLAEQQPEAVSLCVRYYASNIAL